MSPEQELAQLTAEARYAADRVALYRQRVYAGQGDPRRMAELERIAAGAADRLARHRAAASPAPGDAAGTRLARELHDVGERLDTPGLDAGERMRLLHRQAELGDLRDEIALRERRRAG